MTYRVLIVDDQKEVSRLLKSALETIEQGLDVAEAPSGEEAILDATRKRVDLLVADFRLPGITGVELMRKFRALNPQIKIILITGVSEPRLLKEAQNAGADSFFQKPVSIGDFLDAVERNLGMARTILHPDTKPVPAKIVEEKEAAPKGLSGMMIALRKSLNADAVILIDSLGHVQAEAGQLPDPNTAVSLISSLMGVFNAAQKVASLINHADNHLHLFDSETGDGIFIPVNSTHALLLIGKGLADTSKLSQTLERLYAARVEIRGALKHIGVAIEEDEPAKPAQRLAIDEPFTQPENLPSEFMAIFNEIGKASNTAASFWDTVVEKGTTYAEPDKLTYEQASKLGLTPDAPQKE